MDRLKNRIPSAAIRQWKHRNPYQEKNYFVVSDYIKRLCIWELAQLKVLLRPTVTVTCSTRYFTPSAQNLTTPMYICSTTHHKRHTVKL